MNYPVWVPLRANNAIPTCPQLSFPLYLRLLRTYATWWWQLLVIKLWFVLLNT